MVYLKIDKSEKKVLVLNPFLDIHRAELPTTA